MDLRFKALFVGLLMVSAVVLFGCTSPPVCGDNVCSQGEQLTCPADCGVNPVAPVVNATVVDANTGNPIVGATVTAMTGAVIDSNSCGVDLLVNPGLTGISGTTDANGFAKVTVKSEQLYAVGVSADGYRGDTLYQCVTLKAGETQSLKFSLIQLPPKFMCPATPGTVELAVGDSVKVVGSGSFSGTMLSIGLQNIYQTSVNSPYGATFALGKDANIIKVVNINSSPTNLRDVFGIQYVGQDINYLGTCWRSGENVPRAIVQPSFPANGVATRALPITYKAGAPLGVPFYVYVFENPLKGTTAAGVDENAPMGWTISDANCYSPFTGQYCSSNNIVIRSNNVAWALVDHNSVIMNLPRVLYYKVTPTASGTAVFNGTFIDYAGSVNKSSAIIGDSNILVAR